MAKYKIEVVETSTRIVEVEADDVSDACGKVNDMWGEGEIILDETDFMGVDFNYLEEANDIS